MANHSLGTIRGTIEIDYDGAGIVRAVRDTEKTKKEFGDLDKGSSKVLNAFGKFASGATKVASAVSLVSNGVNVLVGVLATVGPLAAAAFAAAPGVILGGVAAMAVFKIAIAGVGDALKAAGGDADKFNEAIKNLSPQAQAFAKAFRAALPQLQAVKTAIQDAFFRNTAGMVAGVVQRIASLQTTAVGVSRALGGVVKNIVQFATSSKSIAGVRAVLAGVRDFLYQVHDAIGPVIQAFIGLGGQAGTFGKTLGGVVANALGKLTTFINSVDLAGLFKKAMPIIQSFAAFFKDVATIAVQVFSIFSTDGANAAGVLAELADKLAAFLQSAQGQAALTALGTAMQAISGAAGQVFLALLNAIAPAIVALAPGVAQLAGQIAGVLVPAINALNPLLTALAGFLSANIGWIGPLLGLVVSLAGAYKIYAAATTAVATVQGILSASAVTATAAWVANTAAVVANKVALVAGQVAMLAVKGATIAWTAVQWLLNAALNANPIGLVVLAIAALVAGIIYAWKNSETFRNVVLAVWSAIKTAIGAVVSWITGTIWPSLQRAWQQIANGATALWHFLVAAWNGIKSGISAAINAIKSVVTTVWNAIVAATRAYINAYKTVIMAGFNAVKAVITTVMRGAQAVVRAVWSAIVSVVRSQINAVKNVVAGVKVVISIIRNAFNSAKSAAANVIGGIISLVRGIPGRVTGALGNLGGLLYSKGQAIIRGFINGIGSMIGAVRDKASSIVHAVTDFLPGSPAKEGPLSGKGYVLLRGRRFMNDLAQGFDDGSQKPVAALMGAINPVARAAVPVTSTTKSGASSAPTVAPSGGGTREYVLQIDGKTLTTLVVDAITGNPVAVKKASDEGARQGSWAGSGRGR